ncbi:MAG: hypothetical protein M0D54_22115 [Hyphomonadaceae bacterium JAD_PAG50586_4]|nr:MAG: hypothetical protein M0D54_22115 [Hyphomonadaceae bacterium JAD_PAG50586_4]
MSISPHRRAAPSPNWFADLEFTWDAIIVRKTGRRVRASDLTPLEIAKFTSYLMVVLAQGLRARLRAPPGPRVWFTPDRPRPWYVIWSAATLAGVRFAPDAANADAIFYFEDTTTGACPTAPGRVILNGGCTDISKSKVARAFEKVAGYPLALDPRTHVGPSVEKSELNGAHDGRIVNCPTPPKLGQCYQAFIDSANGTNAFDYRTTIIGRTPRCVLVKTKPATQRFSIHNTHVRFAALAEMFSTDEINLLTRFAEEMQLDWAAIDVLRDRASGRIYVVDVNKTDTGPAVDLSWADRERLKAAISTGFLEMLRAPVARGVTEDTSIRRTA